MDRGAWQAAVHGVAKSRLQLSYGAHTHKFGWRGWITYFIYLF